MSIAEEDQSGLSDLRVSGTACDYYTPRAGQKDFEGESEIRAEEKTGTTQQTQNRCGIQPDVTGGHIMVAGRRRDANVTLSAADSMGEGRPQRQSCHSICARMDPAGGLCRAGPTD